MLQIKLEQGIWEVDTDRPLGPPGGFGEVFVGQGAVGGVAIKRLKITAAAAAHRELAIGRSLASRELGNVVPILDYGQDADSDRYYLVMPMCDQSLEDYLRESSNQTFEDAKPIVEQIIAGLMQVDDIVHRDLKPANVLWYAGRWCIADFGIAKFVEDSTSLETLRDALTPVYAAPEQWRGERPTASTDVYAVGCIVHRIINGRPPFAGSLDDIREGHLHKDPPALVGNAPARLSTLVAHMLRKAPGARPSLSRISGVLQLIDSDESRPSRVALADAGRIVAQREAEDEAKRQAAETARRERKEMSDEAIKDIKRSVNALFVEIAQASESASVSKQSISLGSALLSFEAPSHVPLHNAPSGHSNGWDVLAYSVLKIRGEIERHSYSDGMHYEYSATLVYCRTDKDAEYRWREISFWSFGGGSGRGDEPFSIPPGDRNFDIATSKVLGGISVAHGPWPIDAEDEQEFHDRWIGMFARAVKKELRRPMQMPPPASFYGK